VNPHDPGSGGSLRTLGQLIGNFARAYPLRTTYTVDGLIVAGLLEGLSVLAVLPVIGMADTGSEGEPSTAERVLDSILGIFGLTPSLGLLLAMVTAAIVMKSAVMLWTTKHVGYSVAQVTMDLRQRFVRNVLKADWSYFSARSIGELANSVSSEAERAGRAYESLCRMAALTVQVVIYVVLTFLVYWQIPLIGLAAGAILVMVLNRLIGKARAAGHRQTRLMQRLMGQIANGLLGMKALKAMGCEARLGQHLSRLFESLNATARNAVLYRQALATLQEPIIVVFLAVGIFFAHEVFAIPLAIQFMLAVLFYRLITRIGDMQQLWQTVMLSESAYWSLLGHLEASARAREHRQEGVAPVLPAPIRVEKVSFAYDDRPLLDGVDLEIPVGKITVIMGSSGSGKTTLADLVVGLRRPQAGRILVGDIDLAEIDLARWRAAIGYVPQDTVLFNASLFSNVSLDMPGITPEQVREALTKAGAWGFASELPDGVDTVLGEGGIQLSGGQRQRLAIARALVRDPALLILDEATSALDPETEFEICETLRSVAEGRLILVITHQPAWLEVADHVHIIKAGRIVETLGSARSTRGDGAANSRLVFPPAIW